MCTKHELKHELASIEAKQVLQKGQSDQIQGGQKGVHWI